MKRKCSILMAILLAMGSIFMGCAQAGGSQESSQQESGGIRLTDSLNREIELEGPIENVIAIGSAVRMYTYVAGTERLIAVERKHQELDSGRPYVMANPELAELGVIGEGFPASVDPELLLEANPDVIIAGSIEIEEVEDIEKKTGIPVVVVNPGESVVFDKELYRSLEIIGQVIGKEDRARDLVDYMEACRIELDELTNQILDEDKPSVYVGGLSFKGNHGIESTASNSPIIDAVNGKNVADEIDKLGSVTIDKEKLIDWDPDILIIDENGLGLVREDYEKNPSYYQSLSAVKNGRVYGQLPYISYYNNIETAMIDVYNMGKIMFPEEFKDIDIEEKADEIYKFFLGQPLYGQMRDKFGGFANIEL